MLPSDISILVALIIGFVPAMLSCADMVIQQRKREGGTSAE